MANIRSQIKRNRQNERRRQRNKVARSELKTRVKRATETIRCPSGNRSTLLALSRRFRRRVSGGSGLAPTGGRILPRVAKRMWSTLGDVVHRWGPGHWPAGVCAACDEDTGFQSRKESSAITALR